MVEITACPTCSADVANEVGRRGRPRIYCSRACNDQAQRDRASVAKQAARQAMAAPCEHCGGVVVVGPTGPVPKWCSTRCNEIARGYRLPESYSPRECELEGCGETFTPKHKNQRCCSEAHGKIHWRTVNPRPKSVMTPARRAALRTKTQRRRALSRDPEAEAINRDVVGERDGWRCGLCRTPVDQSLAYPHPKSASLDHVVPLSLGGKHIETNVQIAHLDCNVAKGNRVVDVQPLLVG